MILIRVVASAVLDPVAAATRSLSPTRWNGQMGWPGGILTDRAGSVGTGIRGTRAVTNGREESQVAGPPAHATGMMQGAFRLWSRRSGAAVSSALYSDVDPGDGTATLSRASDRAWGGIVADLEIKGGNGSWGR
jgi:hypothetical protein